MSFIQNKLWCDNLLELFTGSFIQVQSYISCVLPSHIVFHLRISCVLSMQITDNSYTSTSLENNVGWTPNLFKILILNLNYSIELIENIVIVAEIVGIENYRMRHRCRRENCTFLDTLICISSSFVILLLEHFILMDVLLNLSTIWSFIITMFTFLRFITFFNG
jgi:hypothetical protein